MLSSNEVYYTDESAQGKNFFEIFSDLVIGDVPNDHMKAPQADVLEGASCLTSFRYSL